MTRVFSKTISDILRDHLGDEFTTGQAYHVFPRASKGTIRKTLSRMHNAGIIQRISRGHYRILERASYMLIRVTLSVLDTHGKDVKSRWNISQEGTAIGVIPDMSTRKMQSYVRDNIVPKLQEEYMRLMSEDDGPVVMPHTIEWNRFGIEVLERVDKPKRWRMSMWFASGHRRYERSSTFEI